MNLQYRGRLRLAELVDLERQLQHDRTLSPDRLQSRDAAIAAAWKEGAPSARESLRAWLAALRGPSPGIGSHIEDLHRTTLAALALLGFVLGTGGVGGWLLSGTGVPVNVIRFWPTLVGVQLGLLALWCLSALPSRWLRSLPGLRAFHSLLRTLGGLLPSVAATLLLRFPGLRGELDASGTELRRLGVVYGRLRFWLRTRLTQTFAVAFNAGALVAFVGIPYLDDPAFGWRSRLLEPEALHAATRTLAAPWSWAWPAAAPSLEVIRATRYSSVDPAFLGEAALQGRAAYWGAWWPFLVASIAVYGLAPRLVLLLLASAASTRALDRAPLEHPDLARVRERLARPRVESRALESDPDREAAPAAELAHAARLEPGSRPFRVLSWAGVSGADAAHVRALREHLRLNAIGEPLRVGELDPKTDAAALAILRAEPEDVGAVLLVESQEPPVADYLDFLRQLRSTREPTVPLIVLLVESRGPSAPIPVRELRLAQWRRRLGVLADPWLHVAALAAEPDA